MGFGDKLKGLRDQAQQAVAENRDKIQDAVQVVGEAANNKTHGKYATKIAQVGERVSGNIDKFAETGEEPSTGEPAAAPTAAAPTAAAPTGEPPAAAAQFSDDTDSAAAPAAHEQTEPVSPSAADSAASGFPEFE